MRFAALAAALAFAAPAAHAATYAFGYSLPTTDTAAFPYGQTAGFGVFTTAAPFKGSERITAAAGLWNNQPITGVSAPGTLGGNDNLLFPSAPLLNNNGVTFGVSGPVPGNLGSGAVNVYADGGQYTDIASATGNGPLAVVKMQLGEVAYSFSYSFPLFSGVLLASAGPGAGQASAGVSGQTSAYGVIVGTPRGDGSVLATSILGLWNGQLITGLQAPGTTGGNDNLLYPDRPTVLNVNGLAFGTPGGGINVYAGDGGYTEGESGTGPFTLAFLVAVPEPASLALLGAGLLGAAAARRRAAARA